MCMISCFRISRTISFLKSDNRLRERFCVPFLSFQKALVFVNGGTADVAHSRQFADVELPVFVGGIVAEKHGGVLTSYW